MTASLLPSRTVVDMYILSSCWLVFKLKFHLCAIYQFMVAMQINDFEFIVKDLIAALFLW